MNRLLLIAALALATSACGIDRWRERASAGATGCPSDEIQVSEPTSGSLKNTWRAQCRQATFHCAVAAAAEPDTPAECTLASGSQPPAPPAPAAAPPAPPTDFEAKLATLKRAHEQGLITDQEYEAKRAELLKSF